MGRIRRTPIRAVVCIEPWCCMLAAPGKTRCVVHEAHPGLHPEPLADDEYWDENGLPCPDCTIDDGAKPKRIGMERGQCRHCRGTGRLAYTCTCGCGACAHERMDDCDACVGAGVCPTCDGQWNGKIKKRPSEAA